MKKIGLVFSLALSVLFTSCDKDDAKPNQPPAEGSQIKKMEFGLNDHTSFVYNANNSISKMIITDGGQVSQSNFSYANGKLDKIQGDDGIAYQFYYNNGKESRVDILEDGVGKVSFNDLEYYAASGYLKQVTTYHMTNNPAIFPPFFRIVYDYYNDNTGNVKEAKYYFWDEAANEFALLKTIEFSQYDNKVNPLAQFGIVGYLLFGVNTTNNPGKMVEKDDKGTVTSTSTIAYTYNSKGRPTQSVETIVENGTTTTNTVKFAY